MYKCIVDHFRDIKISFISYLIENDNKLYNFIIYVINMVLPTKVRVDENA